MKKIISTFIIVFMAVVISLPQKVQAVDYNIGLYSYYAWWNPAWRSVYTDFESDPMLLCGPFFSVRFFKKLGFSALFITTFFNMPDASYTIEGTGSMGPYSGELETVISRHDFDLTASYKFTESLTGFIGYKNFKYDEGGGGGDCSEADLTMSSPYFTEGDPKRTQAEEAAGAIGGSYTISLADAFFLTVGTSFLYGSFEMDFPNYKEVSSGVIQCNDVVVYKYKNFGNNTTLNLSYFFSAINTSLSIGGRFQVLKYMAEDDAPSLENDYFYGVTLSAVLHI